MAARRYGKGDLCGITAWSESAYGQRTGDGAHMGVMSGLKVDPGITTEEEVTCGSRLHGPTYVTGRDWSAKVDFRISRDADWAAWFEWAMGTDDQGRVSGLRSTPYGRTVMFKVGTGTADVLKGAYVNEISMECERLGAPLKFSASLFAKAAEVDTDAYEGAPLPAGTPLRGTAGWSCSDARIGTIAAGSWRLTINQNLEKVAGADADEVTNANGQEPYLGTPDVTLEITSPARGRAVDLLRAEGATGLTFTTQIGGRAVTVTGGVLDTEGVQRSADPYDDTIRIRATDVTIV